MFIVLAINSKSYDNIVLSKVIYELWNTVRNMSSQTIRQVLNQSRLCKSLYLEVKQKVSTHRVSVLMSHCTRMHVRTTMASTEGQR